MQCFESLERKGKCIEGRHKGEQCCELPDAFPITKDGKLDLGRLRNVAVRAAQFRSLTEQKKIASCACPVMKRVGIKSDWCDRLGFSFSLFKQMPNLTQQDKQRIKWLIQETNRCMDKKNPETFKGINMCEMIDPFVQNALKNFTLHTHPIGGKGSDEPSDADKRTTANNEKPFLCIAVAPENKVSCWAGKDFDKKVLEFDV